MDKENWDEPLREAARERLRAFGGNIAAMARADALPEDALRRFLAGSGLTAANFARFSEQLPSGPAPAPAPAPVPEPAGVDAGSVVGRLFEIEALQLYVLERQRLLRATLESDSDRARAVDTVTRLVADRARLAALMDESPPPDTTSAASRPTLVRE